LIIVELVSYFVGTKSAKYLPIFEYSIVFVMITTYYSIVFL